MEEPQTLGTRAPAVQDYQMAGYGDYSTFPNPGVHNVESAAPVSSLNITPARANTENTVSQSIHAAGYDSINGGVGQTASYAASGVGENGSASDGAETTAMEQRFGGEAGNSMEEDRLWSIVRANSLEFNAWTALIQETEKLNNILKIRGVYDAFLVEFPLCYGYWKKYADHEARFGTIDKVVEVYERAVLAVTYSVDIWLHYCEFAITTYEDPETIRRLFERGLAYVGTDYLSSPLWDEYIKYEYSQQAWTHVAMLYTRILESPIQHFDRYLHGLRELVAARPLSEILTAEEVDAVNASAIPTDGVEGKAHPDSAEQAVKIISTGLSEAEESEKYTAVREDMYKKAKEYESKIIGFETAIRRPYFHVRPLDDLELENWHNYLDFVERGDDFNKVVKLYERCLIACANYPEYWIRYVLCMEASGSLELANNALARATQVFVKKRPEIHIFAARFKENNQDIPGARAEFQLLHTEISPGYLEAVVKHANMEYRQGDKEAAFSIYEEAIAAERGKELSQVLPMLLVQYSRFLFLVVGNIEKAKEVLAGSFEQVQLSKPLLEAIIHLESLLPLPKRIDYLDSLVEKFITPNPENPHSPSTADREDVSSIYLEFLDLFGEAQSIRKADARHCTLFLRHRSFSISRKRHAEEYLDSEKAKLAKGDMSQAQWASGYGSNKASTWPTGTTAQGQTWNPSYGTQATAYGGYGGYGNFGQQQAATPTSQSSAAAYGAYPPSYSAAGYGQQSLSQPAATAAVYGQQPAAAVPSAGYYGSYY